MPYAVSPFPTLSPPPAPKFDRQARPSFGLGRTPDLTSRQLEAYQKAILMSFPELKNKYGGTIDMKGGYDRLFFMTKNQVNRTAKFVTPQDIIHYKKRDLFGTVEESADAMFEMWSLRAVQHKWITQSQIQHWANVLRECRQKKLPYESYFKRIQDELPESSIEGFQEMTDLPSEQAKQMLALISGKFSQFEADYPNFKMKEHLAPLLQGEIDELFENRQGFSLGKVVLSTVGWLYARVPILPVGLFDRMMLGYIRHRTGIRFQFDDVTPLTWHKIANRMFMQYNYPGSQTDFKRAYDARKVLYKGHEVLLEAGILKNTERKMQKNNMNVLG